MMARNIAKDIVFLGTFGSEVLDREAIIEIARALIKRADQFTDDGPDSAVLRSVADETSHNVSSCLDIAGWLGLDAYTHGAIDHSSVNAHKLMDERGWQEWADDMLEV